MPTVHSSTDPTEQPSWGGRVADGWADQVWRPLVDTRHLVAFRSSSTRRPHLLRAGSGVLVAVTLAVIVIPALISPADQEDSRAFDLLLLLPTFMAGFLLLAIVSAVASGGGRELIAHEHAAAFPVSPTTDHLGALLMAPLNIAWLLQAWFLVGAASWGMGLDGLIPLQVVLILWLAFATALAQLVGWSVEAVRRRRHGVLAVRALGAGVAALAVWLQLSGRTAAALDAVPTLRLLLAGVGGWSWQWASAVLIEAVLLIGAVALGAWPAHLAARRLAKDELQAESATYEARAMPRSDLAMLIRIDRGSVWRAVPMRRGLGVLAVGPGLVALAGALAWDNVIILPGLVVSGGVLLFGVNAWSLDGRGGLWRESLPVDAKTVFRARSWVMAEWLSVAALVTIALASLRAGVPTLAEVSALLCSLVVMTLQVVAVAMSWSSRKPFAVNLRSARATPAPPVVMVGYSARLATSTTLTAMVFSTLSWTAPWWLSVLVALPFLLWSGLRWRRAARRWADPHERARVVTTVAA